MAINIRSPREIEKLREAGKIVAEVLCKLKEQAKPGVSTWQLDKIALDMTEKAGATALFKGVKSPYVRRPFPGAICASVNEEVVHGIPSKLVKLKDGDILSVDFGVKYKGYCGDSAVTIPIGHISSERKRLCDVTSKLLDIAIENSKPGVRWSAIATKMQSCADAAGFSIVTEFVGHGIGTEMHEDPKVPNFVSPELLREDIYLEEGMILAVEPMVNAGKAAVKTMKDGWTVATRDGKSSAHFEHTIAIVEGGCEVLTKL